MSNAPASAQSVTRRQRTRGRPGRLSVLLASATLAPPLQAELSGELGADAKYFTYREHADGRTLDTETGWLPGLQGRLQWRRGRWSLAPGFAWHRGQVDYDGHTQMGAAHHTVTDTELRRYGLSVRYHASRALSGWSLHAGLQRLDWQREIQPNRGVLGLDERYRWLEGSLGVRLTGPTRARGPWQLQLELLRILEPELEVALGQGIDPVSLELGERSGWRASFRWPLQQDSHSQWALEPYVEYWRFGRSDSAPITRNGQVIGFALEPASVTQHWGLRLNYRSR